MTDQQNPSPARVIAFDQLLRHLFSIVMAGLDPVIHETAAEHEVVDGRVKPGHDEAGGASPIVSAPPLPRRGEGVRERWP